MFCGVCEGRGWRRTGDQSAGGGGEITFGRTRTVQERQGKSRRMRTVSLRVCGGILGQLERVARANLPVPQPSAAQSPTPPKPAVRVPAAATRSLF